MSEEFMLAFSIVNAGDKVGKVVSIPKPKAEPGFALIKVLRAGVCNTDLEILKGYMGFQGVLGHEFVGIVEDVESSDDDKQEWIGKRVCGDINVGCATCSVCTNSKHLDQCCSKMSRNHCPNRTVLGILNRNGTMAEYLTLPIRNLHVVPDDIPDEVAVFAEPLAAACRILEQGLINYADVDSSLSSSSSSYVSNTDRVAILGDGKLGLLIAEVLGREHTRRCPPATPKPTLFGKHPHKLDLVAESGVERKLVSDCQDDTSVPGNVAPSYAGIYDVVIDATGSPSGLTLAAGLCRPMGTLVLKSTCAVGNQFNTAPFVIDELRVIGSRCGPIDQALNILAEIDSRDMIKPLDLQKYITKSFPLKEADQAIQFAAERSTMKVQIICSDLGRQDML